MTRYPESDESMELLQTPMTDQLTLQRGLLHRFCAVDLAPNDQLETGFSALDRDRRIIRMDKLYKNEDILSAVANLGPANGTVAVIDMPKSLSIPGKWRQEEIKLHPLRLKRASGEDTLRYETRGFQLYEALETRGVLALLYFNYWTRVNYDMLLPFRSRSPQGCRALQTAIEHQLGLSPMPTSLSPSSVLESMVGAYAAWTLWAGTPHIDYELYQDSEGHRILIAKGCPHTRFPAAPRPRFSRRVQRRR